MISRFCCWLLAEAQAARSKLVVGGGTANNYATLVFTLMFKDRLSTGMTCMEVEIPCPEDGSLSTAGCEPGGSGMISEPSCMAELQLELVIYFTIGQFSQTVYETYFDTIQVFGTVESAGRSILHRHKTGGGVTYAEHAAHAVAVQHKQGSYPGVFMDYSELAIQFGYMACFASCFPLAPLLCFVANVVEIHADGYKVCRRYRRPHFVTAQDIGAWERVLRWVATAAILSNAVLLVIGWEKMEVTPAGERQSFLPVGSDGSTNAFLANRSSTSVVITDYRLWVVVVVIEHTVFLFRNIMQSARPEEPEWISATKARLARHLQDRLTTDDQIAKRKHEMSNFKRRTLGWSPAWIARRVAAKATSLAGRKLDPTLRSGLVRLFYRLDTNCSGTLSFTELQDAHEAGALDEQCLKCDADESGLVSIVEWLDGWENRGHAAAEIESMLQQANRALDKTPSES